MTPGRFEIVRLRRGLRAALFLVVLLCATFSPGQKRTKPAGKLVVAVRGRGVNALAIVDPTAAKVVGSIPITQGAPHQVVVSSDGKLAFVSNTNYGRSDP